MIKAHCMGMEFPKRDINAAHHVTAVPKGFFRFEFHSEYLSIGERCLPTAADLDAVAEEQKAKEQTSGKTDRSQP